jgi:hypothetical protein
MLSILLHQAEQDFQAADEETEDLPLVLMQQQQQQGEAVAAAAVSSNADAATAAGTALPAAHVAEQTLQQQQQQQQQLDQPGLELQQFKRRRLSDASSSSSSSSMTATVLDAAPMQQAADSDAASPARDEQLAGQQQQQQQQLDRKHKHGPAVEGCSYKGSLLDASLLLPPPSGWAPGFLRSDAGRVWRGGRIAPLGANLVLVLYGKEGEELGSSSSSGRASLEEYRVRLVYNEQVLPMPGCSSSSGGLDCSLQEFLDVVVGDKVSYERFKHLCDGEIAAEGWPSWTADGLTSGDMHSELSSSSSSSGSLGGLSVVGLENSLQGLQLESADGLPLLLPAAGFDDDDAVWY